MDQTLTAPAFQRSTRIETNHEKYSGSLCGRRIDAGGGIVLTGHTDRFGTNAYNQKLSERRATAVKEYLVAQGLPATSILAEGKGETQPDTKLGDCKGARSAKVIACLQPDRRVDVEMQGNKMVSQAR